MAAEDAELPVPPPGLRASPGFLLGKAAQQGAELVERALEPLNLKARHYGVLVSLDDLGSLAQHELGQLLRIDRTTMVAVVDELERLRLVLRKPHPLDRRTHQIELTTRGQESLRQASAAVAAADAALVRRLSARERAQLVMLLTKVIGIKSQSVIGRRRRTRPLYFDPVLVLEQVSPSRS